MPKFIKFTTIRYFIVIYAAYLFVSSFEWFFFQEIINFCKKFHKEGSYAIGYSYNLRTTFGLMDVCKENISMLQKFIGWLSLLVYRLPIFCAAIYLYQLFTEFSNDNIFTIKNIKILKNCGILFFIFELIAQPISDCMISYLVRSIKGYQDIFVFFNGSRHIANLILGFLLITISSVMHKGLNLEFENKLIV